jgi:predicted negative regulator of RcsB-dependent stress response
MKQLIIIVILAVIGWQGYTKYQHSRATAARAHSTVESSTPERSVKLRGENSASTQFKCDGRIHCSQMTSCEEATYFLRNCPGTKMDGNNDGVPCEKQWCR